MTAALEAPCRICGAAAALVGSKRGKLVPRAFHLYRCPDCALAFIADPVADGAAIYSEDFYRGRGADPMVDYVRELEEPETTVRRYEWRGIARAVAALRGADGPCRWLDFGCGNGGLVRYLRQEKGIEALGFDEGWIAERARKAGIPILTREALAAESGGYDVVTAIEVFEHLPDPLAALREIRALMRPGALLFYTTGNARPHREALLAWPYVIPEIHVSFYEPRTLERLLSLAGFRPEARGFVPGFRDIIRFKVLKNLGARRIAGWEKALPWGVLARLADRRYAITAHPVGWAA